MNDTHRLTEPGHLRARAREYSEAASQPLVHDPESEVELERTLAMYDIERRAILTDAAMLLSAAADRIQGLMAARDRAIEAHLTDLALGVDEAVEERAFRQSGVYRE